MGDVYERKSFRFDELKALETADGGAGTFAGLASVYDVVDGYGDSVVRGAFTKSLAKLGNRVKVLSQHDARDVIGVADLTDTPKALESKGSIELELAEGRDTYIRLKKGLLDGISIGYETKADRVDKGVRYLTEIDLWEISLVTFPANDEARVTSVKNRRGATVSDLSIVIADLADLSDGLKSGSTLSVGQKARVQELARICADILGPDLKADHHESDSRDLLAALQANTHDTLTKMRDALA